MPILTLTSDIGHKDFLVGAVKGQVLQVNEEFNIVDISHELTPFNYSQAAYVCRNAIRNFPDESFHIILMNLFHTRPEHLLLAKYGNQYIGMADNGLLTMIIEGLPEQVVGIALDKTQNRNTLYCTRVLAQAFTDLLSGQALEKIGNPNHSIEVKNPLKPMLGNNYIEGQIIFIDHFENVIVNITRDDFEEQRKGRSFKIVFKRDEVIDKISETYADVNEGEKLALFNSAGYLEISINKGNAAGLFGLQGYSEKSVSQAQILQNRLYYQTVRVHFE
jgi:S-adenosyl-L-methionine hydrolase (adenosine-forming)